MLVRRLHLEVEPLQFKEVANVLNGLLLVIWLQLKQVVLEPLPIVGEVRPLVDLEQGIQFQFGIEPGVKCGELSLDWLDGTIAHGLID